MEQTAQVSGKDETTQTPNPRALFNMNKGGADEPDNAGNPRAPQGEDRASGTGPGLNPDGLDQLDQGLQARACGRPAQTFVPRFEERQGDRPRDGRCFGQGHERFLRTERLDHRCRRACRGAKAAARKARFTESRAALQGGTITYVFRME